MPFKTLLALTEIETGPADIEAAVSLAKAFGAHLSVLILGEIPILPFYGYGSQGYIDIWAEEGKQREEDLKAATADINARLTREGISFDIRPQISLPGHEDDIVARHAIYCDLAIVLRSTEGELTSAEMKAIDGALFDSGRPVLFVPKNTKSDKFGERAMIAWNARREAARAVSDAHPFLQGAKDISVLIVDPVVGEEDHGEEPGADIALVLSRYELKVDVSSVASAGRPVSQVLLDRARDLNIDLLVMGAYGHSRLRQNILGGTTREMLENSNVPLLLSH
ncbi:universal stress protein [Rhizobiales bacterium]|uniref:universal stress protein n=1 Tax=Hongsoonwoonella zoysiae TaxID=2821844 RepID=UPI00156118AF|nr:universal stress protein [Hongsoonwoonella zoysiae]NRG18996.1 universal stress protein [Hongsoonwoonella zoysiae]